MPLPLSVRARIIVGLPLVARASAIRGEQGVDVMPVDDDRVPAEGAPAAGELLQIVSELRGAALAETVDVGDRADRVELEELAHLRRFPDRALGRFAVAHQRVGAVAGEPMRRALSAMPIAAASPWPSEPVARSTNVQARRRVAFEIGRVARAASSRRCAGRARPRPRPRRGSARRGPSRARSDRSGRSAAPSGRSASRRRKGSTRSRPPSSRSWGDRCPPHSWTSPSRCEAGSRCS